jgi:hypothetical protein
MPALEPPDMAEPAPAMMPLDLAPARAMFAVELIDPILAAPVSEGLRVTAEGFRPPALTPSGRFAWLDRGPPTHRRIKLVVEPTNGMFARIETMLDVPASHPDVPASDLLFRLQLDPTGLYEPPVGMSAVGGMLIEGDGSIAAVPGVSIRIRFPYAEGMEVFTVTDAGRTDARGGFIAMVRGLDRVTPDPDPESRRGFPARLRLERDGEVRATDLLSLRLGRLTRLAAPLEWADQRRLDPDEDDDEDEFVQLPTQAFGR